MVEKKRLLICFGTRPEAIKIAPVIIELLSRSRFDVLVCVTAQQRQLLDQVLDLFQIKPDYDLDLMTPNQNLDSLTARCLIKVGKVLDKLKPACLIVQGDTTTTFASSLAAFYRKIRVAHVEAGLRTYNRYAPFPEEMNRCLTKHLADFHFSPTERACQALIAENVPKESVFMVGNTVIDALLQVIEKAHRADDVIRSKLRNINLSNRIILVTGHRRENFGDGFLNICAALKRVAIANPNVEIVYPVHLNPNVQEPVKSILLDLTNIKLIEPLDYLSFIWLLDQSYFVLTDSGGIQEEAPSLGKPVLVMRETTERPEAVDAGIAKLVGTDQYLIEKSVQELLDDSSVYAAMNRANNPYGDGTSSKRIADILERVL